MQMKDIINIKSAAVLLLNAIYIISAYGKIVNFKGTVDSLKNVFWIKNLPQWFYSLAILLVIVLLISGPGVILYSLFNDKLNKYAKYMCYALAGFTLLATLLYHMPVDSNQKNHLLKNISIIGGLLILSEQYK